jgi:RNA polymerase sigma-70 factor (ECF subfamily)
VEVNVTEPQALEALFEQEYVPLVRALSLAARTPEDAADAVQDAFVQASRHWSQVATYENPAAWLRRVATNRVLNQHRNSRRARDALASARSRQKTTTDPDGTDFDLVSAVRALPTQQRTAIALHYLADLTVADVADAMSLAPGTVKSHLHDARLALARNLEDEDAR